jgi:hypothetical protein
MMMMMMMLMLMNTPCVEVGYNISTVALRVVEDDEKGTRCLGV